ncbi:MAG: nuclease-related domain-containing protein [Erysipelotrichales bacterium]
MDGIIDLLTNNNILLFIVYFILLLIVILIIYKIKKKYYANFGEAIVFRKLKQLYNKNDYPYIKNIILPINDEAYAYYDAIVFGNKYFYIIEIKNHKGYLKIDEVDDWVYSDNSEQHSFINPFYELEVKKHILNRYIEIDKARIIEITVYNKQTKPVGKKGHNHLINVSQLKSLINHYEKNPDISTIPPKVVEEKGNYLLDIDVKKRNIRKKVISDLKNQRVKR